MHCTNILTIYKNKIGEGEFLLMVDGPDEDARKVEKDKFFK